MTMWVVLAALASIAATAALAALLYRMNLPSGQDGRRAADGGGDASTMTHDGGADAGDGGGD